MNDARIKLPNILKNKTKNEIKNLIENNIYNEKQKDIAIRYYVNEECLFDIGADYNVDRRTIKRKLDIVINELSKIG